jgi:hypothetical protein
MIFIMIIAYLYYYCNNNMNTLIPDILNGFIDKSLSTVCKYWYSIWCAKPKYIKLTDSYPIDISKFKNIMKLSISKDTIISPSFELVKLKTLEINHNIHIENNTLKYLTNLTSLSLSYNEIITDEALGYLTNLTSLNLNYNNMITDIGLMKLTKLVKLKIVNTNHITYGSLSNLNIKRLSIGNNISNEDLRKMTNLVKIKMVQRHYPSDIMYTLYSLKNLTSITAIACTLPPTTRLAALKLTNINLKKIKEQNNHYTFFI